MTWFCFPGDFLIFGLTKRPFGDDFLFFSRLLKQIPEIKSKGLQDFVSAAFERNLQCLRGLSGESVFWESLDLPKSWFFVGT